MDVRDLGSKVAGHCHVTNMKEGGNFELLAELHNGSKLEIIQESNRKETPDPDSPMDRIMDLEDYMSFHMGISIRIIEEILEKEEACPGKPHHNLSGEKAELQAKKAELDAFRATRLDLLKKGAKLRVVNVDLCTLGGRGEE